jgi:lipid II isoglutaminyl synthase (glutamine-hydrolysing)
MADYPLRLAHLYPEHMNIYGDRGNIIALTRRCQWRGIPLEVHPVTVGTTVEWEHYDLAFFGGGQDSGQALIADDLLLRQSKGLARAIEDGLVMLAICGGYQLLGHHFLTHAGEQLPGVGVLDVHTVGGKKRLIGNTVVQLTAHNGPPARPDMHRSPYLVGFENHSGRTYHGPAVLPLAKVVTGYGDNGEDGLSGVIYRNTIGCYLHGSLLPKNPHLTDHLITLAIQRRYDALPTLALLDDTLEWQTHHLVVQWLRKQQKRSPL